MVNKIVWKMECNTFVSWKQMDSFVNEAFLQHHCIMTQGKCGGLGFTHYTTYVTPNYKRISFAKQGNDTCQYMLEPIQTIASMRCSAHSLRCKTGSLGQKWWNAHIALNKFGSLCITTMLYLWWHSAMLSTYLRTNPILAWICLTIILCTLKCPFH